MSALPPKADMCSALADVCFGPKADMPVREAFHERRDPSQCDGTWMPSPFCEVLRVASEDDKCRVWIIPMIELCVGGFRIWSGRGPF